MARFIFGRAWLAVGVFAWLGIAGCGRGDGLERYHVSGTVTYQGAPVPSGLVTFSPDSSQGNRGPQGVAKIRDGKFDTRSEGGKAPVPGPQTVSVRGSDGRAYEDDAGIEQPDGKPLFTPWTTTVDVREDQLTIELEVPTAASK